MDDISVEGLDALYVRLEKLADLERFTNAMRDCTLLVEREARKNAPKNTGELARSIQSKVEVEDDRDVAGVVYTTLEYAPYIEYGTGLFAENGGRLDVPWNYQDEKGDWHSTSGMKPSPYLRPALQDNRQEILRKLQKEALTND